MSLSQKRKKVFLFLASISVTLIFFQNCSTAKNLAGIYSKPSQAKEKIDNFNEEISILNENIKETELSVISNQKDTRRPSSTQDVEKAEQ